MVTIHLTSLGCPKNLVDSEVMLGLLVEQGLIPVSEPEQADLLLVNTCGFIQSAVEEGIETILALIEQKKSPTVRVVVTGCMVQRYGGDLVAELPEVDLFLGTEEVATIGERLAALEKASVAALAGAVAGSSAALLGGGAERYCDPAAAPPFLMSAALPRRLSTPGHRAYLKITEGCDNRCSYCLIPSIRGRLRSRPLVDILQEARALAASGVQELTLVAQDLTAYGFDLGSSGPKLTDLLRGLLAETTIPWLRMLYLYPSRVNGELIELVAAQPRILPYFDLPFQHLSDRVLKAMNRPYGEELIRRLVGEIRRLLPAAAIRSTFMVGFPGEQDEDIERLAAFMADCRLDHVGIFTYFNEDGCAAARLPEQCPDEVKEQRRERLMALQAEISLAANQARVGGVEEVLVEGVSGESELLLEGRTWGQAPEIDGCVYITAGQCRAGDLVRVKITAAHPYDLVGEIV